MTLSVTRNICLKYTTPGKIAKFRVEITAPALEMRLTNVRDIRPWCVIRHGERIGDRLELKGEIR